MFNFSSLKRRYELVIISYGYDFKSMKILTSGTVIENKWETKYYPQVLSYIFVLIKWDSICSSSKLIESIVKNLLR